MRALRILRTVLLVYTYCMVLPSGISAAAPSDNQDPLLFLGNQDLPPMLYLTGGDQAGLVYDLARAIGEHISRPVEIELMDWAKAQDMVRRGDADALLQINPTPERRRHFAFSAPLLETEVSVFTRSSRNAISYRSLHAMTVGVERQGIAHRLLDEDPDIELEVVDRLPAAFTRLVNGEIDAVVADRWVGSYIAATRNLTGIGVHDEPIHSSFSAIAVRKENTALLNDINQALYTIRENGTYAEILTSWQSSEVVFHTRSQWQQTKLIMVTAILAALFVALVTTFLYGRIIFRLRRSEAALREAKHKAEDLAKAKATFLSRMSHEIRTPLHGLIGYTDLLESAETREPNREYATNAAVSARSLLHILDDILDYSKLEAGQIQLDPVWTDIRKLLQETTAGVYPLAKQKNLSLEVESRTPRYVLIDPVRVKQILINLLSNAVKFTGSGSVRLLADYRYDSESRGVLSIKVVDTGIGIAKEKIDSLFYAFSQADISITRRFGGTGLGLAISNTLAKNMGGQLRVESSPGHGSTFSFMLPDVPVQTEVYPEHQPAAHANTILIVEDDRISLQLITKLVGQILPAAQVFTASNGQETLDVLERHDSIDTVLMDLFLPGINGAETSLRIRESAAISAQPYIAVLTAAELEEARERCQTAGVDAILTKPISRSRLQRFLFRS